VADTKSLVLAAARCRSFSRVHSRSRGISTRVENSGLTALERTRETACPAALDVPSRTPSTQTSRNVSDLSRDGDEFRDSCVVLDRYGSQLRFRIALEYFCSTVAFASP